MRTDNQLEITKKGFMAELVSCSKIRRSGKNYLEEKK